ncbi:MAG: CBS domain-containing protein, partial [Hyphomicrobiales bacterium]
MLVNEMLKAKRADVITVKPHETLNTLVHRLAMENIGAVVVSNDGESVDGIISERDVVRGLTRHGPHLLQMTVSEIMTEHVLTCNPDDNIKEIMRLMTQRRIRHLPVVKNGGLIGLISIGDVVKDRLELMQLEANVLRDQLVAHN